MRLRYIWPAVIAAVFLIALTASSIGRNQSPSISQPSSTSSLNQVFETSSSDAVRTDSHQTDRTPSVIIGGRRVYVEIADEPVERGRGLSGRDMLAEGWGMLFIFERPGRYAFWMYQMRFPLDIIWIDMSGEVVYIVEDAQPCGNVCISYEPPKESMYVLEVAAGFVRETGLKVGDLAVFSLPSQPSPTR
ncbi:hypothetical protein HRbin01_01804 [archaeon HR01]|nr:hypothetical protein HRbin01_01804 [archaeon HR01]